MPAVLRVNVGRLVVLALVLQVLVAVLAPSPAAAQSTGSFARRDAMGGAHELRGFNDRFEVGLEDLNQPFQRTWVPVRLFSDSDPDGIVVRANEATRFGNGASYRAIFDVTNGPSDDENDLLQVADGDLLSFDYPGLTQEPRPIPWVAESLRPIAAEMVFTNTDPAAPVLRGAPGTVAPNATVNVFDAIDAATPVATATAGDQGEFLITGTGLIGLDDLWVASKEPGLRASDRSKVKRAWVTGVVLLPVDGGAPVPAHGAGFLYTDADTEQLCPDGWHCVGGSPASATGHFGIPYDASWTDWSDPDWPSSSDKVGRFRLQAQQQSLAANRGQWGQTGYGHPDDLFFTSEGSDRTIDVGTMLYLEPKLRIRVVDQHGRPGQHLFVRVTDERDTSYSGGSHNNDLGTTGVSFQDDNTGWPDFPPGDYLILVRSFDHCLGGSAPPLTVHWDGEVATPSDVTLRLNTGGFDAGTYTEPVAAGDSALTLPSAIGDLDLDLAGVSDAALLDVGCGVPSVQVPDGLAMIDTPIDLDLRIDPDTGATAEVDVDRVRACLTIDAAAVEPVVDTMQDLVLVGTDASGNAWELDGQQVDVTANKVCGDAGSLSGLALTHRTSTQASGGTGGSTTGSTGGTSDGSEGSTEGSTEGGSTDTGASSDSTTDDEATGSTADGSGSIDEPPDSTQETSPEPDQQEQEVDHVVATADATTACVADDLPEPAWIDVSRSHALYVMISCSTAWSAVPFDDVRFEGASLVTRAEMAGWIDAALVAAGRPLADDGVDWFVDDNGNPYEAAINRVRSAGIVDGVSEGRYLPDALLTRAQMAKFLMNAAAHLGVGTDAARVHDTFTDDDGTFFEGFIDALASHNITVGTSSGAYAPQAHLSRAQMAAFVSRLLDLAAQQGTPLPYPTS